MKNNPNLFILLVAFLIGTFLYIPIDVYSDSSFDVSSQENFPQGVTFSNDGTKMFVVGIQSDRVYEYALSTPFSVSTSTLANSLNIGTQDNSPQDVAFSNDGTKMFILGTENDKVYEYALSTPFSVSTSTSASSFNVGTQDLQPSGIAFSNDGTKMFVTGEQNIKVYEYALSTPFSVSTSTSASSFNVGTQDLQPSGIAFSNDGTKMFVVGEQNESVYEYALSTPFSVSTSTLANSLNIGTQDNSPQDVAFSNDGTKMFILGKQNVSVYEYALSAPFDLVDMDSPTFTAQYDSFTLTTVTFSERINGTLSFSEWFFDGNTPTAVSGYDDHSTLSAVTELVFTHTITSNLMPDVRYTGNTLTDGSFNVMATATVTADAPRQTTDFNVAKDGLLSGVKFSTDGAKMFIVDSQNATVYEYALSTPFDVSTSTSASSFNVDTQDDSPSGITFSNNGAKMFIVGSTTARVYEYALSTPFDVSTSTSASSFNVDTQDDSPSGITFSNDGTKMFVTGEQNDSVYAYALSVPFVVTTSTLVTSLNVSSQDTNPSDVTFSTNGEKMFIVGTFTDLVYEYALSTSYDVTTSTFTNSLYLGLKDNSPQGITFSNNGGKMFIVGSQNNTVYEYILPAPFDLVLHPPTFTAQSDSSAQTTVTFSEVVNGILKFSEWSFAESDTTAVSGYGDNSTLSAVTELIFIHDPTSDQTPSVTYTGSDLAGSGSNVMDARIITTSDGILPTFTAQSNSSTYTTVTFSEGINGILRFSEWSFDGNVATTVSSTIKNTSPGSEQGFSGNIPTSVSEYADNSMLSNVTKLVFTHFITNDQTPTVTYTGNNLQDDNSNILSITTVTASDEIIPTFTAQSDSSAQTTVTFSEGVNGILKFSEWSFAESDTTVVSGYGDNSTLSAVTELIFIHDITNNQTPDVVYSGTSIVDDSFNSVPATTVTADTPLQTTDLRVNEDELSSGVTFSTDGVKMFIIGAQKDSVYEYTLSVPFSVTTFTFTDSIYIGSDDDTPSGVTFSNNGAKMFIVGTENGRVYEYALSVPFNVTSSTLVDSLNVTSQDDTPSGVTFSNNGAKMFIVGTENGRVYEYALSVPFSVASSTLVDSLNVTSQDDTPSGVTFSNNGAKMFIVGTENGRVYEYALSVPFNVTSSTFTGSLYVSLEDNSPQGITFSNNGGKMFIVGSQNDSVYEYALPASFDLVDTTQPTITGITSDATTFGTLKVGDIITFTLTTDSFEAGATINGTYNSQSLSWSINDIDAYTATYTVSEGDAEQTTPLQITDVTITDSTGITGSTADGNDILKTIDANSPQFSSAQTISISQITITLDQDVTDFSASPGDFALGGVTGGSIRSIVSVSDNIITLDITGTTISDKDAVTIAYARTSGSFDDEHGNQLLDFTGNVVNTLNTTPPVFCSVPDFGNWIITSDCTLNSDVIVSGSVIVQNNTVLVIPDGITLDIDFVNGNLTVESESGVLIKSGGTIT